MNTMRVVNMKFYLGSELNSLVSINVQAHPDWLNSLFMRGNLHITVIFAYSPQWFKTDGRRLFDKSEEFQ